MLTPAQSTKFRKDVKRMEKRGKDMNKLKTLLTLLINEQPLPDSYQAHPLNWATVSILKILRGVGGNHSPQMGFGAITQYTI